MLRTTTDNSTTKKNHKKINEKRSINRIVTVVVLIIFDFENLGTFSGGFMIHHWMQHHQGYRLHLSFSHGKRMDGRCEGSCEV
jgi:hypothetical protein